MKFHGKSEQVAKDILQSFESGDIRKPLAQIFIRKDDASVPCHAWSFTNQVIVALKGHSDARGFKQWDKVGRKVKKGEKACYILGPCFVKKEEEDGEEKQFLVGFRSIPVFGLAQTDGEPMEKSPSAQFIDDLPLVDVARAWGLKVTTYGGARARALGYYRHRDEKGVSISLGTENLSTWAHELIHAADHKAGNLTPHGKKYNEIVAELGGAVLLTMIGRADDADLGGCWDYVRCYAGFDTEFAIRDCMKAVNRVGEAVNLILTEAEGLKAAQAA